MYLLTYKTETFNLAVPCVKFSHKKILIFIRVPPPHWCHQERFAPTDIDKTTRLLSPDKPTLALGGKAVWHGHEI